MQDEIDLRPYVNVLIQRWHVIALAVIVAMIAAMLMAISQPQVYTATADIIILPSQSQLTLDSRFVTNNASLATDVASRRQSLIGLASSPVLEEYTRLLLTGSLLEAKPGSLARQIKVTAEGDLLHIEAQNTDPQKAKQLADAWAKSYTKLVNELYNRPNDLLNELENQLADAQQIYDIAQQEFESFIGSSDIIQLTQQISSTIQLLNEADASVSLLYAQYQAQSRALEATIQDAETLRQQLVDGNISEVGNNLALLALQARVIGEIQLPVELRFDDPNMLFGANSITATDLTRFIKILQQRRSELLSQSLQVLQSLQDTQETATGIPSDIQKSHLQRLTQLYQQLEQQNAKLRMLSLRRDQAFDRLSLIQNKLNEQHVSLGTSVTQVRFINSVVKEPRSMTIQVLLYALLAAFFVLFFSIVWILLVVTIRPWLQSRVAEEK